MTAVFALRRGLLYFFEALALVAFVTMLCSSLLQVFFRHVLSSPLMWTEELARLMCVLTTYFGSVVVLIAREHIRVEMIDSWVTGRSRDVLGLIVDLLIAWFLVSLALGCWYMTSATWNTFTATMGWFRMAYIYIAVGVAVVAMTLVVVLDLYTRVLALAGRGPSDRGPSDRGGQEARA